jgi:fatty acid desaturase
VSSVFLYVAIVAIWAFVLVPRWLRRHHGQPRSLADDDFTADSPPEAYEDADEDSAVEPSDYPADESEPVVSGAAPASRPAPMTARSLPRSRMMQARRRLLTILVLLAAAAGGGAAIRFIPWWTCVAPIAVLVCYFLLLRTAARADADHARRLATVQAREARIQAAARRRATVASAQGAQIIDISSRVGDQLYDQYADATVRAVGD